MKENNALSERYIAAMERVHAPDELLRKVEAMNIENTTGMKRIVLRRALCIAAVIVVLLMVSNAIVYAATGETWVEKLFWYDEKPVQPMDNVQNFFNAYAEVLGEEYGGNAAEKYYGGTYLDGGEQVILLTDLSKAGEFTDIPEGVRLEKCDYTRAELTGTIKEINAAVTRMKDQGDGYAADIEAWGLYDRENRLFISIYQLTEEKEQWFRENVCDQPYLVFENADSFPQED